MRRRLVWVPILAAGIASVLMLVQGGFGGGHGSLDQVIWMLGLPGALSIEWAPEPFANHDLLLIVVWPAIWNALFWAAIARLPLPRSGAPETSANRQPARNRNPEP